MEENIKNNLFTHLVMSKQTLKKGTKFLKQALIVMGLTVVGLMLFSFIPVHAQGLINPGDVPGKIATATGGQGSFRQLVLTILNFFLGFLGLLAVVMIIYGGILYVSAAGAQEKIDKGKKIIMYAIVGIVIILLSFAIVNTVLGGAGTGTDA
jgi:hypothetical protein